MRGRVLAAGAASGSAMVLREPLSLWGGMDPETGELIDVRHPQRGASLAGRIVVMRETRGSSSSSSVLAEAVRGGHAPAAILLAEADLILAVGAMVAEELYGVRVPVLVLSPTDLAQIRQDQGIDISEAGEVALR